ncbi:hypothetical protein LTR85_012003 [Meristemomyces frigidus]|nr:hypothetical protein LTR85_012003 [Meristemomyces frigidus]
MTLSTEDRICTSTHIGGEVNRGREVGGAAEDGILRNGQSPHHISEITAQIGQPMHGAVAQQGSAVALRHKLPALVGGAVLSRAAQCTVAASQHFEYPAGTLPLKAARGHLEIDGALSDLESGDLGCIDTLLRLSHCAEDRPQYIRVAALHALSVESASYVDQASYLDGADALVVQMSVCEKELDGVKPLLAQHEALCKAFRDTIARYALAVRVREVAALDLQRRLRETAIAQEVCERKLEYPSPERGTTGFPESIAELVRHSGEIREWRERLSEALERAQLREDGLAGPSLAMRNTSSSNIQGEALPAAMAAQATLQTRETDASKALKEQAMILNATAVRPGMGGPARESAALLELQQSLMLAYIRARDTRLRQAERYEHQVGSGGCEEDTCIDSYRAMGCQNMRELASHLAGLDGEITMLELRIDDVLRREDRVLRAMAVLPLDDPEWQSVREMCMRGL